MGSRTVATFGHTSVATWGLALGWWFHVWHAWMNVWHNRTSAQGTVIGGTFVVLAAVIAFGTGSLNRRGEDERFHYTELKALYAEALTVTGQMAIMGERVLQPHSVQCSDRRKIGAKSQPSIHAHT